MDDWSFNVREQALCDTTGTDEAFSNSFFKEVDKPGHEKNIRRSTRVARKKKSILLLLEKEEKEVNPQPPSKKMKKSAREHVAQTSTKPAALVSKAVSKSSARPSSKKEAKNETPSQSTAALPKSIVKGRMADTDLGEFFKYKSDKGKGRRRKTNPKPFGFMLREEQKKRAREAKKQASKQNMITDGDIVFNARPVASTGTSTAAMYRLAQPKKKAPVEQDEKKEKRRMLKARRTTQARSPKFRTAERAASRKFSVAKENKQKEGAHKQITSSRKPFKPTVAKAPNFHTESRVKKRALPD